METKINEVVEGMMMQIKAQGIKPSTVELYQNVCNTIIKYATTKGDGNYSEHLLEAYLSDREQRNKNGQLCNEYLRFIKRVTRMMKSFAATREIDFSRDGKGQKYKVSASHQTLIDNILNSLNLVNDPRYEMDIVMRHFFYYIESKNIEDKDISDSDFFSFLSSVSDSNKGSMGRTLRALKYISAHMKERGIADLKVDLSMLMLKTAPVKLIPAYSQEEISRIFSTINLETAQGLRDNAILLLAFETGLRAVDIRNLTFSDIDWKGGEVTVVQSKTKEPVTLPLNGKVLNAIADYILKARPVSDLPQIFLTIKGPAKPFSSAVPMDKIIEKYCTAAGVEKIYMRSFHSLRRSFAIELSLAEVPLPTISQMLGHKSISEDKAYLSYNRSQVSFCALDFSDVPIRFGVYKDLSFTGSLLRKEGDMS